MLHITMSFDSQSAALLQPHDVVTCAPPSMHLHLQAVYTSLREAEYRSTAFVPYWNVPLLRAIVPRQRRCTEALKIINATLDSLIQRCKDLVKEEEQEFVEEFVGQQDPSILHFLLASGDQVGPDATLCNHPISLICVTLQFSDICMSAPQCCFNMCQKTASAARHTSLAKVHCLCSLCCLAAIHSANP